MFCVFSWLLELAAALECWEECRCLQPLALATVAGGVAAGAYWREVGPIEGEIRAALDRLQMVGVLGERVATDSADRMRGQEVSAETLPCWRAANPGGCLETR